MSSVCQFLHNTKLLQLEPKVAEELQLLAFVSQKSSAVGPGRSSPLRRQLLRLFEDGLCGCMGPSRLTEAVCVEGDGRRLRWYPAGKPHRCHR
jgi:hypothetical protein